jgi:hypothetical protein
MKNCLRKTFSQAEYVAAIAYMFRRYRVPVVKEVPTESEEAAQRKVMDVVTGNRMVFVMQTRNHEKVALAWKRLR